MTQAQFKYKTARGAAFTRSHTAVIGHLSGGFPILSLARKFLGFRTTLRVCKNEVSWAPDRLLIRSVIDANVASVSRTVGTRSVEAGPLMIYIDGVSPTPTTRWA